MERRYARKITKWIGVKSTPNSNVPRIRRGNVKIY
jgi:hypothetical protein